MFESQQNGSEEPDVMQLRQVKQCAPSSRR